MKIKIISFLLSFVFVLFAGCGEKIESTLKNQELTIDGDGRDWEIIPLYYLEDMNIVYGIVNDDETVDVMIRFNDDRLARVLSMRGFTLWFNEKDEEQKQIGIHYKDDSIREKFLTGQIDRFREKERGEKQFPELPKPTGKFTLAKNDSLTTLLVEDIFSFEAAADVRNGIFCYEFRIPLTSIEGSPYYLNLSNQKAIKVCLEIMGLSEEEKEHLKTEMKERRESMPGGNMSVHGRGGMRGRGNRPQLPDMDNVEYWISVLLAQK